MVGCLILAMWLDTSSQEQISKAHEFESLVDDISGMEWGTAWSAVSAIIIGVLIVNGTVIKTLSDAALAAAGIAPNAYNFCLYFMILVLKFHL